LLTISRRILVSAFSYYASGGGGGGGGDDDDDDDDDVPSISHSENVGLGKYVFRQS
jgi:hypothetical protein